MTTSLDMPRWRQILAPGISTQVLDEALAERIKERLDRLESENQRLSIKAGEMCPPRGRGRTDTVEVNAADFAHLIQNNAQLRAQVDDLQGEQTRMVNRQLSRRVREFHVAMGLGDRDATSPRVPNDATVRGRLRLITEEFFELLEACYKGRTYADDEGVIEQGRHEVMFTIASIAPNVDLPELTDALADLEYVIEGTRAVFGIDGAPVMDAVHEANMAKAPGGKAVYREDGKILKPEGWKPPDVAGVLRRQGWRG